MRTERHWRPYPADPSCVLHLPFYKYGSEQTKILDISGNSNHGVITGAVPATYPMLPGPELVGNGDMEAGNPPTGWSIFNATATIAADAVTYHGGSKSVKITLDASGSYDAVLKDISGLTAGKHYKVSAWFRGEDLVAGNFWLGFGTTQSTAMSNGGWVYCEYIYEGLAETQSVYAGIYPTNAGNAGKILNVDDISLREVTSYEGLGWHEDGVNDKYTITDSANLRMGANNFAILTWVRPEYGGTSQTIHTLFSKITGGQYELTMQDCTASPLLYGYVSDGVDSADGVISVTPISMNRWHLLGMYVDRTADKMYGILDGVLDHTGFDISAVGGDISPTGSLFINASNGQGHKGARGDFIIFNPLSSTTEIRNYFELTKNRYGV